MALLKQWLLLSLLVVAVVEAVGAPPTRSMRTCSRRICFWNWRGLIVVLTGL